MKTAPTASAYVAGLRLLGRRELSETQMRQRLARRGYPDADIATAVARLKEEHALDDRRVAGAMARTETAIKRRGRVRVRRQIEQAGIDADTAREAVDSVFADLDDDALLASSLARRLKDDRPIADEREFQRLYRYLVGQGFESHRVLAALAARRRPR
jgi:regulatory protein